MPPARRAWLRRFFLLLACAWPIALHAAVEFAPSGWAVFVTASAIGLGVLGWAWADRRLSSLVLSASVLASLGACIVFAPALILFAPPVIINATVAWFFGASLAPGREPVIALFARFEQGGQLPDDLGRHARIVTWCWTVLLATNAALALLLALFGSLETWSLFTNVIIYALIGALFLGEYAYRRLHFRHHRHASLWALMLSVRSVDVFGRR